MSRRWRTISKINSSYFPTDLSTEKKAARSSNFCFSGGLSRVRNIASARPTWSPTATSGPILPACKISDGPEGQSVLTHGQPHARASINTLPNPSISDEITNREARDMKAKGLSTHPGNDKAIFLPEVDTHHKAWEVASVARPRLYNTSATVPVRFIVCLLYC